MKKGLLLLLLVVVLSSTALASTVRFKELEDFGEVYGNGSWDAYGNEWVAGPATENWIGSHNKYKNFVLEFEAILNGRTLIIVRGATKEGPTPWYKGAGIDLVDQTKWWPRVWTEGGWSPSWQDQSQAPVGFKYGELIHVKITAKDYLITFEITDEDGWMIFEYEMDALQYEDTEGYIWLRSTSPLGAESLIMNLQITEL